MTSAPIRAGPATVQILRTCEPPRERMVAFGWSRCTCDTAWHESEPGAANVAGRPREGASAVTAGSGESSLFVLRQATSQEQASPLPAPDDLLSMTSYTPCNPCPISAHEKTHRTGHTTGVQPRPIGKGFTRLRRPTPPALDRADCACRLSVPTGLVRQCFAASWSCRRPVTARACNGAWTRVSRRYVAMNCPFGQERSRRPHSGRMGSG